MSTDAKPQMLLGVPAIAQSPAMVSVLSTAERIAKTNASVLITGETGSGKEIVARAIHHYSLRCNQAWIDVNCAALPDHLVESELFGYEKGAFSGADAQKPGFFELASGGSLFLDEIGELEPKTQVKLLRVLDGTPYYRVGGVKKVTSDVRVIAATSRDLSQQVARGGFRNDLYHRLNQIHLRVPPLRERPEDILPLANFFLHQVYPHLNFSEEAKTTLQAHQWNGNVRELRNAVLTAAVFCMDETITVHELPANVQESRPKLSPPTEPGPLQATEKHLIFEALRGTAGHQQKAARILGISRRTLSRKLRAYGLHKR
ncbi:MAG TPA: sigma-54 dependent transcriptional regulator [Terriglobales bacterium]|nr:sigma-54 dependent transcriptional regulator [Terriglobales bacterium]